MSRQRTSLSVRCTSGPGALERNQAEAARLLDVPLVIVAGPPGHDRGVELERMLPEACTRLGVGMSGGGDTLRV